MAVRAAPSARFLSYTPARLDDSKPPKGNPQQPMTVPAQTDHSIDSLKKIFESPTFISQPITPLPMTKANRHVLQTFEKSHVDTRALENPEEAAARAAARRRNLPPDHADPYHLHVTSHKHNTHISFCNPKKQPIFVMSCGHVGFRKHRRGSFDSGYTLTKRVFERLTHDGWALRMQRLALVFKGFGHGREAAIKCLMGPEGSAYREKITRVADATSIKFGGIRARKPRRV
ncbi:hypothetical protein CDD81_8090 [Ophiocordyceps australis]|uniref:Ribosomal protein S11 n=1 Tax=Ophiocordyceps australis TaxID=1399860 RepID=A0A2C5X8T0_9HYPO|nr:hypothetical protein CDD81_8090 [Ophiocordyceps australis]